MPVLSSYVFCWACELLNKVAGSRFQGPERTNQSLLVCPLWSCDRVRLPRWASTEVGLPLKSKQDPHCHFLSTWLHLKDGKVWNIEGASCVKDQNVVCWPRGSCFINSAFQWCTRFNVFNGLYETNLCLPCFDRCLRKCILVMCWLMVLGCTAFDETTMFSFNIIVDITLLGSGSSGLTDFAVVN